MQAQLPWLQVAARLLGDTLVIVLVLCTLAATPAAVVRLAPRGLRPLYGSSWRSRTCLVFLRPLDALLRMLFMVTCSRAARRAKPTRTPCWSAGPRCGSWRAERRLAGVSLGHTA